MLTKRDLETLAETRLADAAQLFGGARYSGAYYLAGYAVELAIKACIADVFQADVIPERSFVNAVHTHKLDDLLALADVRQELQEDMRADAGLAAAWGVASQWNEAARYALWDQVAAAGMIRAVGDERHGVLQWLKKRW